MTRTRPLNPSSSRFSAMLEPTTPPPIMTMSAGIIRQTTKTQRHKVFVSLCLCGLSLCPFLPLQKFPNDFLHVPMLSIHRIVHAPHLVFGDLSAERHQRVTYCRMLFDHGLPDNGRSVVWRKIVF